MDAIAMMAGGGATALLAAHIGSALVAAVRQGRTMPSRAAPADAPAVTIIRPLKGLEPFSYATLKSTFLLSPAAAEILFCIESEDDAAVPIVRRLIAAHPDVPARLLVGRDVISANPKLNNLVKGWREARHPWIAFVDSNVLLPVDALAQLADKADAKTGMVCSPPVGMAEAGFGARLECAFLNGLQARWQTTADSIGHGFAQGKVMYFRRGVVEAGGGLTALGAELAEDAAATKLVRAQGLHVRLVDRFFAQPIGRRSLRDVWDRQLRWAILRRASFPSLFATEIASGGLLPLCLAAAACVAGGLLTLPILVILFGLWYGVEQLLARHLGWPSTFLYSILRDALAPIIWVLAWVKSDFTWQGNAMRSERASTPNASSARHIEHSPGTSL